MNKDTKPRKKQFLITLIYLVALVTLIHLTWVLAYATSTKIVSAYMESPENPAHSFLVQGDFSPEAFKNLNEAQESALIKVSKTTSGIKNAIWLTAATLEIVIIVIFSYPISSLSRVRSQS